MPKQKFAIGQRVHITKDLGPAMSHFYSDMDGIVKYTYAERYGSAGTQKANKKYCVVLLDENNKYVNTVAWYKEHQLTLVSRHKQTGYAILAKHP